MSDTPCTQRDLAVGWALHALEPEEEAQFALHLPHCGECQAQVTETEEAATLLGSAVPQLDPPARLRASILEAARAAGPAPAPRPSASPVSHRHDEPAERPVGSARRVLVAAGAVVVLALGGLGGFAVSQSAQGPGTSTTVAGAASDAVLRDLADPAVRQVRLTAAGSDVTSAVLLAAPDHEIVLPVDLPEVDGDQAMWVWGIGADGVPVPLGDVVDATDGGGPALGARQVDSVSDSQRNFDSYAMSVEPGNGTPTEPTTLVASGSVGA